MSQTTNLTLPYLAAGQAQKHVTVNESLRRLDAIVQLAVVSASVTAQPSSPADGAVWIVPSGKTGAQWSAFTNWSLGYHRDGAWEQITPREGWLAFVKDTDAFMFFDGADWETLAGGGSYTDENARDAIGAALVAGANVTITVNDAGDTITIAATGGGGSYTTEEAQDAAAALFTPDDGDIDFTYNDATPSIAAQIKTGAVGTPELADDAVTFDKLLNATGAGFIAATGAGAFSERTPAQARDLIGLDTDDSPQFTAVNLGHASDTTLTRSAAGVVAVEGVDLGWLDAPQRSISAADTFVLTDRGKHLYHPAGDTTARAWTIPANASVAFPIGTIITIVNENGAGVITLGITSDTLRWGSSTGSRTLAANAVATLIKVTSTLWRLTGDGIT